MLFYLKLLFFLSAVVLLFLTSITSSLGTCRKYVTILLKLFEFGRKRIEKRKKRKKRRALDDDASLDSDLSNRSQLESKIGDSQQQQWTSEDTDEDYAEFNMWNDVAGFIKSGIEAVIEDEVTKRFHAEELSSWNLLTRNSENYIFVSIPLSVLWCLGCIFRYVILLPLRLCITVFSVSLFLLITAIIGYIPNGNFKQNTYRYANLICFRIMAKAVSAIITFHNPENKAKGGGICVANHTSPIDILVLSCDNHYSMVGQRQGGFLGILQHSLSRAAHHTWFERFELKDRALVAKSLKEHCSDLNKSPILMFPEGTCINNTSVMMFKKGSFEVDGTIYPTAIKYDPKFGDPFWDSSKHGWMHHLLLLMSSWALVCQVWYLPSMSRKYNESAVDFANRVKAAIAKQGQLVNLNWDGQLKRIQVKKEWKELKQFEYSLKFKKKH